MALADFDVADQPEGITGFAECLGEWLDVACTEDTRLIAGLPPNLRRDDLAKEQLPSRAAATGSGAKRPLGRPLLSTGDLCNDELGQGTVTVQWRAGC